MSRAKRAARARGTRAGLTGRPRSGPRMVPATGTSKNIKDSAASPLLVPRCRQPATHSKPIKSSAYVPASPRWHHRRCRWCHKKRCADNHLATFVWRSFYLALQKFPCPHARSPAPTFSRPSRSAPPTVQIRIKNRAADAQIQRRIHVAERAKSRARTSIPMSISMRFRDGFRAAEASDSHHSGGHHLVCGALPGRYLSPTLW